MSDANGGTAPESQSCFRCRKPTARRCIGCLDAPDYSQPSVSIFYCRVECQKADWPRHKKKCQKLQARKSLSRAASLLQAIIKIKEHATTLEITSVHVEDTTVYLNRALPDPFYPQQMKAFPVHLFEDLAILQFVLVYTACMEAMVFLYSFTMELLRGQVPISEANSTRTNLVYTDLCSEIQEVTVNVIEHELRIGFYSTQGPKFDMPQSMFHNVYRVVLKQGKTWTIDPTGAQFGFYKPLCSWNSFQKRISKVDRVDEPGYIRHKVFFNSARFPIKSIVFQQAEKEILVKSLEHWLLEWKAQQGEELSAVLQGSEAAFESAKNEFLELLGAHVKKSLAAMYIPIEIAKRTKEAEARMTQNQADPTSVTEFEGFLKFFTAATSPPSL